MLRKAVLLILISSSSKSIHTIQLQPSCKRRCSGRPARCYSTPMQNAGYFRCSASAYVLFWVGNQVESGVNADMGQTTKKIGLGQQIGTGHWDHRCKFSISDIRLYVGKPWIQLELSDEIVLHAPDLLYSVVWNAVMRTMNVLCLVTTMQSFSIMPHYEVMEYSQALLSFWFALLSRKLKKNQCRALIKRRKPEHFVRPDSASIVLLRNSQVCKVGGAVRSSTAMSFGIIISSADTSR